MHFYFDGEVEDRDAKTIEDVYEKFVSGFSKAEMTACGLDIERIDEPDTIEYLGERVFARKEKYGDYSESPGVFIPGTFSDGKFYPK